MMLSLVFAAALSANFDVEVGKVRPELHSSGFGPTICEQTEQDLADVKAMGFKYARTHDWGLINPNQRVCDYFHIFPLMHLDATDPKNYVFGPTDYLLKRTREEAGIDIFYRLGTSIEHSGDKVHFNTLIPEDFNKMAEIFASTVRHYNRGWADGYRWNIKYWEIWNEPDGIENMWSPKEGIAGLSDGELRAKRVECRKLFVKFFVTVLKRLKTEFGDEIKVGGPALCCYDETWFREILGACKQEGLVPDFISWHGYVENPMTFNETAEKARAMLDEFGFTKCEMIVNEWHYFGYREYDWNGMQRSSDPKVKERIWTGPLSHNGINSACYTLATLANMQRSKLSQAYFYGCEHKGDWGFKDPTFHSKYKIFHALKLFGDLVKKYPVMCASSSEDPYTTLAVKSADGQKKALLVVEYGFPRQAGKISFAGVAPNARATITILDNVHDLEKFPAELKDGMLDVMKLDQYGTAELIEFE